MKLGFSSLALFMKPLKDILEIAIKDKFEIIEILCEGPYLPRYILEHLEELNLKEINEFIELNNIEIFIHSPTIDLNPASMNIGIRQESEKQIKETLEFAHLINAKAVTTHPGIVHRREKRIRDIAIEYTIDTLKHCQDYAEKVGVNLSIENMPKRFSYLASCPQEHEKIVANVGSSATIDWGHVNTYKNPHDFLKVSNILYFHLNDNSAIKDQHLSLGEGNADFSSEFLKQVKYGIIELNSYDNVLKSKEFINKQLQS
ncbi:sugar phosphate isomerase/epimerase family protein [Methanobrevibacter filiformis]|uniref:Endonuclease 4 n=1 Tax=Methanobrevibacter filiformis TaxID=55758 RepID=A0A166FIF3_9EURY|nr:sugar phosphate isomerase/epimerase [Methanobrevibacter filiformis]KZX17706.1 endonuclease 4 [Methanobrevibacter filiformis]